MAGLHLQAETLSPRLITFKQFGPSSGLTFSKRRVVVSYKRKYVHELLVNRLFKPAQEKVWLSGTDRPAMTIAVDLGRKATKQTNKRTKHSQKLII